jgi:hypothetical protein
VLGGESRRIEDEQPSCKMMTDKGSQELKKISKSPVITPKIQANNLPDTLDENGLKCDMRSW